MTGRVKNSFALVKASARVLAADKELLVFPLVSGIAALVVATTFIVPAAFFGWMEPMSEGGVLAYAFGFLFYLAQYTVIFFFNTALVGAALIRLDGGDPTLADGMRIAFDKLGVIVEYAALAATVGMILRMLSERLGALGNLVVSLVGIAWTLATYMVVPVLVTRDLSPWEAVKESASLFKRTWGEQVVGNASMGIAFFLMFLSFTLFAVPFMMVASSLGTVITVLAGAAVVAGYVFLALASAALKGIYAAALYRYATTGEAGYGFDAGLMERAFVPK